MKKLKKIKLNKRIISVIIACVMLIASAFALEIKWLFDEFSASAADEDLIDDLTVYGNTYIINSYTNLVKYSKLYNSNKLNHYDYNIQLGITDPSDIDALDEFESIGTSGSPYFNTKIEIAESTIINLPLKVPFFDYIYDTSSIVVVGTTDVSNITLSRSTNDSGKTPLFANHVVHKEGNTTPAEWSVTADVYYDGDDYNNNAFWGIIGTIEDNALVSLTINRPALCSDNDKNIIDISGSTNVGLACGTMNTGSTLSVTVEGDIATTKSYSVTSESGNAGGLVGEMVNGSVLTVNGNISIEAITSTNGYAGGIVGSATEATVHFSGTNSKVSSVYDKVLKKGGVYGNSGTGGVFGYYETAENADITISNYKSTCTVHGNDAGGIIGEFKNKGKVTFDSTNIVDISIIPSTDNINYGGLIGKYTSQNTNNTLNVNGLTVNVYKLGAAKYYGGVIGSIDDDSYVQISDVKVIANNCWQNAGSVSLPSGSVSFGGLVGYNNGGFIDADDITINIPTNSNEFRGGGVVGYMNSGVLRLSGITDLSGAKSATDKSTNGQIVGQRGNQALIYALPDWKLIRSAEVQADDIATWGEVLRFNSNDLKEEDVLTVNQTEHTVTVQQANPNAISSRAEFAKLALNIQMNNGATTNNTLNFDDNSLSSTLLSGEIKITGDIDLSDTGITGLMRDDGKGADGNDAVFSSTLSGGNHTITLAIGESYGSRKVDDIITPIDENDTSDGNGKIYRHGYIGLFARTNGVTVNNIIINGDIIIKSLKETNVTETTKVGGLSATHTGGKLEVTDSEFNETIKFSSINDRQNIIGGMTGSVEYTATNTQTITVSGSVFGATIQGDTDNHILGGAIGWIKNDKTFDITFTDITLSGSIEGDSVQAGGLISEIINYGSSTQSNGKIVLTDVTVDGQRVTVANDSFGGGLLGNRWISADAEINGLTVDNGTVTQNGTGHFAGLVYAASGYWKVYDNGITINNFTANGVNATSFGLLINNGKYAYYYDDSNTNKNKILALYLELTNNNAYTIDNNVALSLKSDVIFDELVASCTGSYSTTGSTTLGNNQAVVSIHTENSSGEPIIIMDGENCNTYQNQTTIGKTANGNTRYYYNLDYIRNKDVNDLSDPEKLMLWSVNIYAYSNIKKYFTNPFGSNNIPAGNYDMEGYSYYPVDISSAVSINNATFKFYNVEFEKSEKVSTTAGNTDNLKRSTRVESNKYTQHYRMHCGLFRNVYANITAEKITFQGSIGTGTSGRKNSGVLVCDQISSGVITYTDVKLDGIYVDDFLDTSDAFAALLINNITANVTVRLTKVYTTDAYKNNNITKAAASLIGNVGSKTGGKNIKLIFSDIRLDGRTNALANTEANAALTNAYKTEKSIFTRSILVNALMYPSGSNCSAVYNFKYNEDWNEDGTPKHYVTYGAEIYSSNEYKDENGVSLENKYMSSSYYTNPETPKSNESYDFSTNFLPYVKNKYEGEDSTYNAHEVKVNVQNGSLDEGCGTYNDPYIIKNKEQLNLVAEMLGVTPTLTDGTVINYHADNYQSWCENKNSHYVYVWDSNNSAFYPSKVDESGNLVADTSKDPIDISNIQTALSTAYYELDNDDIILNPNFTGLGRNTAFKGVINGNGKTITTKSVSPLIYNSLGSVVKNLNIVVAADFTNQFALSASSKYEPLEGSAKFYGGVIGIINGGDNIIDNVEVTFSEGTNITVGSTTTTYSCLGNIAIGGYIGVLRCGGVIFRNMENKTGLTSDVCSGVGDENTQYLYQNAIIGRVIDGFAVTEADSYQPREENVTMKNGTKNYSIADIDKNSTNKLTFSKFKNFDTNKYSSTITVPDSQSLFLMGCITMSGAGKLDISTKQYSGNYTLFGYGGNHMVRHGDYSNIGTVTDINDTDYQKAITDGYGNTVVPYIIYNYTQKSLSLSDNSMTIEYPARALTSNLSAFNIVFNNTEYDLPDGFKGIGSLSYFGSGSALNNEYSQMKIYGIEGNNAVIKLNMSYYAYSYGNSYYDNNKYTGFGLFNTLLQNESTLMTGQTAQTIKDLTITGTVKAERFDEDGTTTVYATDLTHVGGLAGTAWGNSKCEIKLENVKMNNLDIVSDSAHSAGGLIGYLRNENSSSTCEIKNCGADNLTVTANVYAGGMIGYAEKHTVTINKDSNISQFKNITINSTGIGSTTNWKDQFAAGGLIGYTNNGCSLNIYNMHIINSNIEAKECSGGIIGKNNDSNSGNMLVDNCTVENTDVQGSYVGGIAGITRIKTEIKNCKVTGNPSSKNKMTARSGIGGIFAFTYGKDITIDSCSVENYEMKLNKLFNLSDYPEYVGGFVGKVEGSSKTLTLTNSKVSDCTLKNETSTNGEIGGIIGFCNSFNLKGYNIVSDNVQITNNTDDVGYISGKIQSSPIKLVGVCVKEVPESINEYGNGNNDNGYIIYSDSNGTCLGENPNIEVSPINNEQNVSDYGVLPYATINPMTPITIDGISTVLTGDGVSKTTTNQIKETSEFAFKDKISTFKNETGANIDKDFPVLVVNDSTKKSVTNMINSYINILTGNTNIENYAKKDDTKYIVDISSYRYNTETQSFQTDESYTQTLIYDTSNQLFGMNTNLEDNEYDNIQTQFTLLDIQYKNPSNTSEIAYHLYIPVMVEKMLKFDFDVKILSGTTYNASEYTKNVVMESYGTPVTIYVKYSYQRTLSEWQSAINIGENILESYGKSIVCQSSVNVDSETRLVLVDRNNNSKAYYSTIADAFITDNKINFNSFKAYDGTDFTSVSLYELLSKSAEITATEVTEPADDEITFVECQADAATVQTTDTKKYFRLKTNEDTNTQYTLTITANDTGYNETDILPVEEDYYISFFTKEDTTKPMINMSIGCAARLDDTGMTPSHISTTSANNSATMILGNLYTQTMAFSTSTPDGKTEMSESNHYINANVRSTISINESYKGDIQIYLNDNSINIYHGFVIEMTRTDDTGTKTGVKGRPQITGTYTIKSNDTEVNTTEIFDTCDSAEIELTGKYNGSIVDIGQWLKGADSLVIECDNLKITYDTAGIVEQFPERPNDDSQYGVTLSAKSNMAYVPTNIIYSGISQLQTDSENMSYYLEKNIDVASLNYNINRGTSDADAFSKLGVNGHEPVERIDAVGYYDLSNIPDEDLDKVTKVKVKLSLFQKQNDGSYIEMNDINEYLKDITLNRQPYNGETSLDFSRDLLVNNVFEIPSGYTVISGDDFEKDKKLYSNYRVRMTVQLFDENDDPIANSLCDDYIIYTNAKIYTELMPRT